VGELDLLDLSFLDVPSAIQLLIAVIVIVALCAFIGAAGFAATMMRRQTRFIADLTEKLANGVDVDELEATRRIRDPRLRKGFDLLAQRIAQTWTLATQDQLTQVANRQALLTRLDEEIARATRYERQLSVVMIDIDHFKRINDTYGHVAGDIVLHRIAQVIQDSVRRIDVVGRYGGEEFLVILPETEIDAAASIAEKIRRLVGREAIELPDGTVLGATLSAGVAGGLGIDIRLDALIRDADGALYSAKSLGRDQVYIFHEVAEDRRVRKATISPAARESATEVGRAAMRAAMESLATVLGARPGWAGAPSTMIAESSMAVARALGLPEGEIERIRTASLLHDLGKIAIPDEILSKPDDLDESEWRVVTEHPKIGQVVLEQAGALRDAATIVLHHHEWFDGRGYPHGLNGPQIPVGARIVAVADAYEAMVAGRPYREAISHDQALAELKRHAGLQFDPEIVAHFAVLFAEGMPWPLAADAHAHAHPHPDLADEVTMRDNHGALHDALHARRLRIAALEAVGAAGVEAGDGAEAGDGSPGSSIATLRTGTEG
jgi:diguanylate cyclase (GGDEF)-like protein